MKKRSLSATQWTVLIALSIAIGILVEVLDRVIGFPDGGITPWILLGIFWIGMLAWIWRDHRKRKHRSDDARAPEADGGSDLR